MKLLLTFVVCTVLDYVHTVTFRAAMRDDTLDHDGAPPGQFFDTEYHLEHHQLTYNHYPGLAPAQDRKVRLYIFALVYHPKSLPKTRLLTQPAP